MKYNLTGQTFSFLTVIEDDGTRESNGSIKWKCKCICGNITYVNATNLMKNKIKSCGCKLKELNHEAHLNNLTGKRFGKLVAIKYAGKDKGSNALWLCKCDCGNEKIINSVCLLNGNTKSCGCLQKENRIDLTNQKFGKLTALYPIENKKNTSLKWHCKCECGNQIDVFRSNLTRLHTTSCGCQTQSIGEQNIKQILDDNHIKYLFDSTYFKDLKSETNHILRYDFILLNDNNQPYRIIEFDGRQHVGLSNSWGQSIEQIQHYDKIKNNYALSHNIPLVRIPHTLRDNLTLEILLNDMFLIHKGEYNG